jgi:hypothetical protein
MRTSKRGRRRPPAEELRISIGKMWDAGATQTEIADALQVSDAAVRFHLQKTGVPPSRQHKGHPVIHGKRICVQCGKNKNLASYPSPRHAICTACIREKRVDRRS